MERGGGGARDEREKWIKEEWERERLSEGEGTGKEREGGKK